MNFFQYRCYLYARVPRVKLEDGKIKQVKVPWEGVAHGFTLLFEALIMQFAKVMPVHQICQTVGVNGKGSWEDFLEDLRGTINGSKDEVWVLIKEISGE